MSASSICVLHTIADLNKVAGGGSRRLAVELCVALGACGVKVSIVSQAETAPAVRSFTPDPKHVHTHFVKLILSSERGGVTYSPYFKRKVIDLCRQEKIQIIHDHGIWLLSNHAAANAAYRLQIPRVIHLHGMLQPWALEHRAWKKRLAWLFYQRRDMENAALFIATSSLEAEAIRRSGLQQPIAIIAPGVQQPTWEHRLPGGRKIHSALFLSRIHPVKGLLNLVAAWNIARPKDWRMIIAGSDENHHRAEIESAVHDAGLTQYFEFIGPVYGAAKETLYREVDLFILPSFSENFGLVIGEALSYGIPVITTRGAPWQTLATNQCGWWVEAGIESLAEAIQDATSRPDDERHEMGERGRKLIENELSWSSAAAKTMDVYKWILNFSPKPPCIID